MVTLKEHGKSYFAETSLHGLKYITEDDRHPVERILWIFLFFAGVALMITFMIPGHSFRNTFNTMSMICSEKVFIRE